MDRDRVKNYFSGSNYDNRSFSNNNYQQPISSGPTMNYVQPMVSSQGDISVSDGQKKSKAPFIAISLIILFVFGFVAYFVLNNSGISGGGGGGPVSEEVLTISKDSYMEISSLQSSIIQAKNGNSTAFGFFSEQSISNVNSFLSKFEGFYNKISKYNPSSLSNESARESLVSLKTAVNNDMSKYRQLVDLYNLFYDYVNNDYGDSYREAIINTNNEEAVKVLDNLDAVVKEYGTYEAGSIVADLFNAALGSDYPEVLYYELIGNIIGGLDDGEDENEE